MSQILVVGSLAYDSIKTPAGQVAKTLGGSANYFSVSASLLSPVRVVGVVGEDYEAADRKILQDRRVDLSGMTKLPGKTFHWEGFYDDNLNEAQTLKTELNVFADFDPTLPENYRDSKFVFLANIDPLLQLKVLEQVKSPVYTGMDTMNFWIQSKKSDLLKVLKKVDALLINEGESKMLTGKSNAIAASKELLKMGPETVVIKRGEYGLVLNHRDQGLFLLPAFPIEEVVDPTGAGDTFAGGFFGYLSHVGTRPTFGDLKKACLAGSCMASFTVQDFGLKGLLKVDEKALKNRQDFYQKHLIVGS
ncbi:MAG: PfkB family carbohydrate kinase [Bdellovibrionales bacterium]